VKIQRNKYRLIAVMALTLVVREAYSQAVKPAPAATSSPAASAKPQPQDPLGRDTPRGCVVGFLKAAGRGDFSQAAEYLDVRTGPARAQKLAQQLRVVLDQGSSINLDALSRSPEGDLKDELRPNRDQIGAVQTASGKLDIILDRVTKENTAPIWLFSSETLRGIPQAFEGIKGAGIERFVPEALRDINLFSVPLWRWLVSILFIALAFLAASIVTRLLEALLRLAARRMTGEAVNRRFPSLAQPLRLLLLALAILPSPTFAKLK